MSKQKFVLILCLICFSLGVSRSYNFLFFDEGDKYEFPDISLFPPLPETDNPPTKDGVELGRYLFYDKILSGNHDFSCATCHRQEAAFSDSPNQFSKGSGGELLNRNTMPLFNLAWYPAFFWDGKAPSLEQQVFHPVRAHNEMNLAWKEAVERIRNSDFYREKFEKAFGKKEIDSFLIARAIAQFERTLISADSKYDRALRRETSLTKDEYDGFVLINDQTKGDCLHCHTTDADVLGTTTKFSNNGLDAVFSPGDYKDAGRGSVTGNENENGLFRIPSLRNVALTAPYMHDGRFKTLEEVLDFYSDGVNVSANIDTKMGTAHKGGAKLSSEEKRKIIAFLHALTDSTFIANPEFSDPFRMTKNKSR